MRGREHLVKNEIIVLKRVSQGHNNILTLVDYFESLNNLYLITDIALGDELFDRIYNKGSFYESDASSIIRSIVSGVAYLHSHGIVHRDLKPENLLFRTMDEDSDLLIADFGLSRIIDEEQFRILTTTCGTPAYMAPEIFKKSGHGKPVDVWAIGVITYFLLCGYTPFDRDTSAEEMQAIINADYSFEPEQYWEDVSEEAKDFIRKCLQVDISARMTAEECMKHEFLNKKRFQKKEDGLGTVVEKNEDSAATKEDEILNGVSHSTNCTNDENGTGGDEERTLQGEDQADKPEKRETDLLPTVKSNLNLRRLTTPSGSMDIPNARSNTLLTNTSLTEGQAMNGAYCLSPQISASLFN